MPTLEVDYRNANLRVELGEDLSAQLFINNIQRAQDSLTRIPGVLRLASPVQTDYEWHEIVEAVITFDESATTVSLNASNAQIAFETWPASGTKE